MDDRGTAATVLRADVSAYRRWFGTPVRGLGVLVALVGGGVASALRRGEVAFLIILLVVTVAVTLGCIAIHIASSRVVLTSDRIEYRRWLRRTRIRLDDDLVGALAELKASPVGRTSQVLVLRARSGGPRIRLNGAYWEQDDLVRIAAAADVPVLDGLLTPRELDRAARGTMPWRALHPWLAGFGGTLVLLVLIVAGFIAWFDATNRPPFDDQPPRGVSARTVDLQGAMVTELQQAAGGEWESPESRLSACEDDAGYKGWSRRVSVRLRESLVEETGEDRVVTPIAPSRDLVDSISKVMVEQGSPEPLVDLDDLAEFGRSDDAYLRISSYPDDGDALRSTVEVTFSGSGGYVSISMYSACETPPR